MRIAKAAARMTTTHAVALEIEGERVLLCQSSSGVRAALDICPHQELSLDGARLRGNTVICPHHGARFDLGDGRSLSPLTQKPLRMLPCRDLGDEFEIEF